MSIEEYYSNPTDADVRDEEGAAGTTIDAPAGELGNVAQQFDGAEAAERRQEGIEPEGVFDGPFDPATAWAAVVELNDEYQAAIKEEERTKKIHASAKTERDELGKELSDTIAKLNGQRGSIQPPLKTIVDEPTSEPTAGRDALLQDLSFKLLGRQCFLTVTELAGLSDEDRGALHTWATAKKRGPLYPPVLATAHVAAEPGTDGQHCAKCGALLPREEGAMPYVVKSFVGFGCVDAEPEEARPIAKRGSKKTKKVEPEAERVEQAKVGRAQTETTEKKRAKKRGRA